MRPWISTDVSNLGIAVLIIAVACTRVSPHAPSASPEPTPATRMTTEADSWSPRTTSSSHQYFFRDSSTVTINNDTTAQVLPIETTMTYSVNIVPAQDSFSVVGTVDSSTINSRLQTRALSRDSTNIKEFHGALSTQGKLQSTVQLQSAGCSSTSNSTASRIYELILPYPKDTVRIGDKWSDTVSSTSCHGRTPLTQRTIREFEIKEFTTWHQRSAVEVQRLASITFAGASSETNTHLSASGSGSGEATLLIDRNTGALLESVAHTKSMLTIVTSRGEFPFTQVTSTHITTR